MGIFIIVLVSLIATISIYLKYTPEVANFIRHVFKFGII